MNPSTPPCRSLHTGIAAEPLKPRTYAPTRGEIIGIGQKEQGVYQEDHARREIDSGEMLPCTRYHRATPG